MSNSHLTEKGIIAIALAVFIGGGFTAGTWYWVNRYDFVARVNGERITHTAFSRSLEQATQLYTRQLGLDLNSQQGKTLLPMLKQTTLNQLIDQTLMLQEAQRQKLTVSEAEVTGEYDKYLRTNYQGDKARMERELARNNYSLSDFRQELRQRLQIRKLRENLTRTVQLSETQFQTYYTQNKERFTTPEKIEARHILIKAATPAQEAQARRTIAKILTELKAGKDFGTLARKYSQDTSNKDKGGDLGAFAKGEMVAAFEQAAWALKPGEYTQQPVKTEFGFHLILRGKTLPAGVLSLKEARQQFGAQLLEQEKEKSFQNWLKQARTQAEIEIAESLQTLAATETAASPSPDASAKAQ